MWVRVPLPRQERVGGINMTETELMQRAKTYIDKLANGINPLDDTVIDDSDVINNVRLSRCLFYVSDVLRQVIENGGSVRTKTSKPKKTAFTISFEDAQKFEFSDVPISVSEIAKRINAINSSDDMKKLTYKNITDWLVDAGILCVETHQDGKTSKSPTDSGRKIGITTEERTGAGGKYTAVLYNRSAQQFIIDNIDSVINMI